MTKKRKSQIARDACSKGTDLALPEQAGIAPVADDSASPDIEGPEELWLGDPEPVRDLALASLIAARRLPLLSDQLPWLSDQHWAKAEEAKWSQAWDEAAAKLHSPKKSAVDQFRLHAPCRLDSWSWWNFNFMYQRFRRVRAEADEVRRICGANAENYLRRYAQRLRDERESSASHRLRQSHAAAMELAAVMVKAEPAASPAPTNDKSANEYDQFRQFAEEQRTKYGAKAAQVLRDKADGLGLPGSERIKMGMAADILDAEPYVWSTKLTDEYDQVRRFAEEERAKHGTRATEWLRNKADRLRDPVGDNFEVEWRQAARLDLAAAHLEAVAAPLTGAERAANRAKDICAYGGAPVADAQALDGAEEALVAAACMDAEADAVCDRALVALAPVLHRRRPSRRELAEAWAEAAEALDFHYLATARRRHLLRLRRSSLLDRRFARDLLLVAGLTGKAAAMCRVRSRNASAEAEKLEQAPAYAYDLRRQAERADRAARLIDCHRGLRNDLRRLRLSLLDRWRVVGILRSEVRHAALAAMARSYPDPEAALRQEIDRVAWIPGSPSIERLRATYSLLMANGRELGFLAHVWWRLTGALLPPWGRQGWAGRLAQTRWHLQVETRWRRRRGRAPA